VFGVADRCAYLGKLLYGVANLLVQNLAVGDNDNRILPRRPCAIRSTGAPAKQWSLTCRYRLSAG
jgi:hypothetical protein